MAERSAKHQENLFSAGILGRGLGQVNDWTGLIYFGQAKILDFGLAKLTHPVGARHGVPLHAAGAEEAAGATATLGEENLSSPGVAMGTIAYMSPEQARGEDLDARTDLFSLGVVLYEMATGRQAFSGTTAAVIHDAILNRAPVSPVSLNPGLAPKFEEIINKALEKEREVRYQHASDIRTDLKRLKRDTDSGRVGAGLAPPSLGRAGASPVDIRRAPQGAPLRRHWRGVGLGLAGLVAALAIAYLLRPTPPPPQILNCTGQPLGSATKPAKL